MLVAVVRHADHFGAMVKSFDDSAALKIPGVVAIRQIPQGVAVLGESTFAALKGRDAVNVEWDLSKAERRSSAEILGGYRQLFATKGLKAAERGDVDQAFAADGVAALAAEFEFPFLAHAPMEPLDAVIIKADDGSIDCYTGAQFPGQDRKALSEMLGVVPEQVRVHTQLAGGSFGRRAQFGSPYMREAAEAFKAAGMARPVKHLWTREDDIRGGYYRPIFAHKVKAGLSRDGTITAWDHQIAGQSIMKKSTVDETSVEGVTDLPYTVPNLRVQSYNTEVGVPMLWWRSVGHTHTAFVVESLIDELLEKAGKDPVEGRLELLEQDRAKPACSKGWRKWPIGAVRCRPAASAAWRCIRVSHLCRADRRGVDRRGRHAEGSSRLVRGRLRHGGQSRHHQGADGGRHRIRARCGAVRRDHARRGRTIVQIEFPRLPIAAHQRDAGGRSGGRSARAKRRPVSASPARRRSGRLWPMPGAG